MVSLDGLVGGDGSDIFEEFWFGEKLVGIGDIIIEFGMVVISNFEKT